MRTVTLNRPVPMPAFESILEVKPMPTVRVDAAGGGLNATSKGADSTCASTSVKKGSVSFSRAPRFGRKTARIIGIYRETVYRAATQLVVENLSVPAARSRSSRRLPRQYNKPRTGGRGEVFSTERLFTYAPLSFPSRPLCRLPSLRITGDWRRSFRQTPAGHRGRVEAVPGRRRRKGQ